MPLRWLNVALCPCVLLTACFGTHGTDTDAGRRDAGRRDAGPPVDDGGSCYESDAIFSSLSCPASVAPGEVARVTVEAYPAGCCGSGDLRLTATADGSASYALSGTMSVCDCCRECDCIGPVLSGTVEIGPLAPGRYEVVAGDQRCGIEVRDPGTCADIPAEEVRMPRVLFVGQPLPATLITRTAAGCSCTPAVLPAIPVPGFVMEACGCCRDCRCIDPGYEVGGLGPAPEYGDHTVIAGGLMRPLSVHRGEECPLIEPADIQVVGPDPTLVQGGANLWWARVSTNGLGCCVEPQVGAVTGREGSTIQMDVRDCTPPDPCDCEPPPGTVDSWVSLGELDPGRYTIRAAGVERSFTVP